MLGPLFIGGLLLLIWADSALGRVDLGPLSPWLGIETLPPGAILALFFALLVVGLVDELTRMLRALAMPARPILSTIGALLVMGLVWIQPPGLSGGATVGLSLALVFILMIAAMIGHAVPRRDPRGSFGAAGGTLLITVYLGVLPAFWLLLRREESAWVIAAAMLATKMCDIGAYFTGRAIGRHKLIPWLSPGKTWEGLAGGLAWAAVAGLLLEAAGRQWLPDATLGWTAAAVLGAMLGLTGQLGDLTASALKRDAGVKDSGSLPGFGGLLDVLDSPIMTAPVAWAGWYILS